MNSTEASIEMSRRDGRLVALEACRGIAAYIVIVHHVELAFAPGTRDWTYGTPFGFVFNGGAAVTFFFVLSGFVLSLGYFERRDVAALSLAVIKRLPRLYLPVAVSIFAGMGLLALGWDFNREAAAISGSQWLMDFGSAGDQAAFQMDFAGALWQSIRLFFDDWPYFNTSLWTMQPELFGSYIVFMAAPFFAALPRRTLVPVSFFLILVFMFRYMMAVPFLCGMLLALYHVRSRPVLSTLSGLFVLSVALVCLSYFTPTGLMRPFQFLLDMGFVSAPLTMVIHTVGGVALIAAVMMTPAICRSLSNEMGRWLGRMSFPVYLMQIVVICSISSITYLNLSWAAEQLRVVITLAVTLVATSIAALPLVLLEVWWVPFLNRIARIWMRNDSAQMKAGPSA